MPSLRRSVSESMSMSRSSPYPSTLSLSAAGALNAGTPNRPRRTTSDTTGRRVLADIEWWRILDGQQDDENDNGNGNGNENGQDHVPELQPALLDALQENVSEHLAPTAVTDSFDDTLIRASDASQGASLLTTPFAALSISAVPPMTPPRSRTSASESPISSVESTPQSSPRTPALERETLFADMPEFDCSREDAECVESLPPFLGGARPSVLHAMAMMRSASFGGFDSARESPDERFGDVIFI